MNRLYRYSLLGVLLLGVVLVAAGTYMWNRTDYGSTIVNWITPSSRIPAKGNMSTWGVAGASATEPDEWHFHVVFSANRTARITLMWNLNETILFEKSAATIDESFNVALPRTAVSWRWDWVIRNPDRSWLGVYNFTVTNYSITHPQRQVGSMALGAGFVAVLIVPIAFFRHRDVRRIQ
jgi:hypothetical protein